MLVLASLAVPSLTLVCVCACGCVGVSISSLVPRLSVGGERESLVHTVCACV